MTFGVARFILLGMEQKISIMLVGAGSMGGALLKGWLTEGLLDVGSSTVIDPGIPANLAEQCRANGVRVYGSLGDATDNGAPLTDLLVFAVKPQMAEAILPDFASRAKETCAVSVMAGKGVAAITKLLGGSDDDPRAVIRTMPNLPASIGAGMTGLYAPDHVAPVARKRAEQLMRAAGDIVWVETEEGVDFVTAVSGSGPAYFFLLAEALAKAGEHLGLTEDVAARLARQTLIGAGALQAESEDAPAVLRKKVTSPGGTTAAALDILDAPDAFRPLLKNAALAAAKRAKELTT